MCVPYRWIFHIETSKTEAWKHQSRPWETQILEDRVSLYNIQPPTGSQSHINWSTELNLQQKLRQLEYNNNSALSH